jgi:hypothetical protein
MSDTAQSAILEALNSIQAKLREHDRRFDRLEETILRQGRDSAGALMMMRATAGDFEQRIAEIRDRIEALDRGNDFGPTGGLREP